MTDAPKNEGLLKPYEVVTNRIVELLAQGVVPWRKPWNNTGAPRSLATGAEYRGINTFLLSCEAALRGYASPYWMTFNQCRERGGKVRKGETSAPVVFWKLWEKDAGNEERDDSSAAHSAKDGAVRIPILRYYRVFNVAQCEGIAATVPEEAATIAFDPIIQCESIVAGMPRPPEITHGGGRAAYFPRYDKIAMPPPESFVSSNEYYGTLFHEIVHSTGHGTRLDRESIKELAPFGTPTYAKEELIAEMGAAFLCARAGIAQATLDNSAAYIQGWLAKLRGDPKLVVYAAAAAQKAADYVLDKQERGGKARDAGMDSSRLEAARLASQRTR